MKILAGVETPTTGEILIDGNEVHITKPIDSIYLGISMVHQELIQIEDMSVAENIFIGRYETKAGFIDEKALRRRTSELMERLNLQFDPDSLVRQYSVAHRQLIEIIKALSHEASILIFDEPTAALTLEETGVLYQIIRQLRDEGIAVILISHRMEDIYAVGDRVMVLRDGQVSGGGAVSELSVDDIVKLMVGRQITQQFPEKTNHRGEVVLAVKHLENDSISDISFLFI